jgi:hypothetical protein
MSYNLDVFNSTNTTNYYQLTIAVNEASDGVYGMLLMFAIFIFFLVSFRNSGLDFGLDNWIYSSFLTIVVGVLLFLMGLIAWYVLMIPVSMLIIMLIVKFFS